VLLRLAANDRKGRPNPDSVFGQHQHGDIVLILNAQGKSVEISLNRRTFLSNRTLLNVEGAGAAESPE
jgi:hypothetical protein